MVVGAAENLVDVLEMNSEILSVCGKVANLVVSTVMRTGTILVVEMVSHSDEW